MVLFKKRIENTFVKSFLYYVPFAVLGAMTIPDIFSSTSSIYSAIAGTIVAIILSFKEKGLLASAISACVTVYAVEWIFRTVI
jgi:branched-subunit amino acid transport protein